MGNSTFQKNKNSSFCYLRINFQEEELRSSLDPKYQHLQEDLHVEITAFAPPAEAHARIAYALTEDRKYLIPDSNDEILQEHMREMEMISTKKDVILKCWVWELGLVSFERRLYSVIKFNKIGLLAC